MTIPASTILDSARGTLLDAAARTWSATELLQYLNEFLRATAGVKADFYVRREFITLAAGDLQVLPDGGVSLMGIDRNESGRNVNQVDYDLLNNSNGIWAAGTKELVVEDFATDPRDPRRFIVSPPNNGSGRVRALFGAVPPTLTSAADPMPVLDIYEAAAIAYVLSRAYAKNSERQDLAKSGAYKNEWLQLIGLKSQTQVAVTPRKAA